jgi:xylulokinase
MKLNLYLSPIPRIFEQNLKTRFMLLLGIDVGTSSIKASVVDSETKQVVASAQYPDTENTISSPQPDWAEQDPETWWEHTRQAIKRANTSGKFNPKDIVSIGISYQMHGWNGG